ncbi:hypothetical protein N9D94_07605 [Gammaproteobacteria bacterium]|nr:hypothetical protein [Gammaproteobacteria bacterium]
MGLFKSIKKRFKKLGSSIAKRMRKIGRGVKKGFSKITKAFGKLGPLGQLALFFILPGMGNVLTSWMGQFGSKVMNMLPSNFAATLTKIGTKIKAGASFAYENTIGRVYNTVSKALTGGIDAVTAPFTKDGVGAATKFKNFVSETANKFSATPDTLTGPEVTQGAKDSLVEVDKRIAEINAETGAIKPSEEAIARQKQISDAKSVSAERRASAKEIGIDTPTIKTIDTPEIKEDGIFRKGVDKLSGLKTKVGDADVLGTGVQVREVASVAKDASGVFSAYKYFNPDNVEGGFYNPNIGMANQLNQPNDPYTTGGVDATFIPMNPSSNMNSAASAYAGIFGNPGPDPINTAIGAPGYGLTFADYATGGTVYG